MRIAIGQLALHIGHFEHNVAKMQAAILQAAEMGADLVVFSELSVCGYPPRDFLEFEDFIDRCQQALRHLSTVSPETGVLLGCPMPNPVKEGKDLYNAAIFLYQGRIQTAAQKALLPTYDIFDEYRYFEPATHFSCLHFKNATIAVTICEDIWNVGNENPLYTHCPMDVLTLEKPDFMINLSASPFDYQQAAKRLQVVTANTQLYGIPLFYVNQVGAQTELIFDGCSMVVNAQGEVVDILPAFEESLRVYDTEQIFQPTFDLYKLEPASKIELIHDALVCGIRDYFKKLGFQKAILGLSGGIDSAVTAVLAARALGAEHVHGVLMPSPFSSKHSVEDAEELCRLNQLDYTLIPIGDMYNQALETLTPALLQKPFDVTEENIQARLRGLTLMAMSNKHGYILLNTTNKSEAAVGYGTLYGDLCGGLAVLADIYKTEVYELAAYLNKDSLCIPLNSIQKAPSAELKPNQTDQDTLPPYPLLDAILRAYIEERKSPQDIIEAGFEETVVKKALNMVNNSEWKRFQMAPVLRVSPKSFGSGRRMPIEGKYQF